MRHRRAGCLPDEGANRDRPPTSSQPYPEPSRHTSDPRSGEIDRPDRRCGPCPRSPAPCAAPGGTATRRGQQAEPPQPAVGAHEPLRQSTPSLPEMTGVARGARAIHDR